VPFDRHCGRADASDRPGDSAPRWFAAHELRTPLQAIQGGVALLLEDRANGLSPLQVEAVSVIAAAAIELERCTLRLAELAALDETPDAPPRVVHLDTLLGALETQDKPNGKLPSEAVERVEILTVPELVESALNHLATLGVLDGPPTCELEALNSETVTLAIAIGPPTAGEGAIAWRLAMALFERAGVDVHVNETGATRLTLRRVPRGPI
jgi:signal transduction histidine kinase